MTTDSYDQSRGKLNVMESLEERMENVRKTGLADLIIKEELEGQKIHDIRKYGADVFVIGSDWSGKFDYLRDYCEVVYLERTKGVSSTDLRSARNPIVYMGIAGHGRIAGRFLRESKYVSNIEITAVFGRRRKDEKRQTIQHPNSSTRSGNDTPESSAGAHEPERLCDRVLSRKTHRDS